LARRAVLRINYVLPTGILTGGIRTFYEVSVRLIQKGHEISLVFPEAPGSAFGWQGQVLYPRMARIKKFAKKALDRYLVNGLYSECEYLDLESIIPECDVNFATTSLTAFTVHRSGRGRPFYHMQHYEPLFTDDPRLQRKVEETYYLPLTRIANSSWLKKTVYEKTGADSHLVLHGMDHGVFYPRETPREGGKKRIVAFAKQATWKGVPDLLEAMEIVFAERKDVELILFGSHPITHTRKGVPYKFLRGISDDELARLYSSADVVACPSWYESFPLPPLEAMACGAPVATTRIGTEDYAFDGENALVVPPRDPKRMAGAILELLKNESLCEQFRKAGPKTAKEFSWDKTADNIDSILRKVVK